MVQQDPTENMEAFVIYANNDPSTEFESGTSNQDTFTKCQKVCEGYIEFVYLENDMVMVVNEDGLLIGLPQNFGASFIASRKIVGNAVVCPLAWVN